MIEHAKTVSLAWSPDGKLLAAGDLKDMDWSLPKEIRESGKPTGVWLFAVETPDKPPLHLRGHQHTIANMAFSPDGGTLVSIAFDGTRFWNVPSGSERFVWPQPVPGYAVGSLAFSPDGVLLAGSCTEEGTDLWSGNGVFLLRRVDVEVPEVTVEYDNWVGGVLFEPGANVVSYYTADGSVHVWDLLKKQEVATLYGGEGPTIVSMRFHANILVLFVADDYGSSLQTWNWETGEHQTLASLRYTLGPDPAFHPTEPLLAVAETAPQNRDVVEILNWGPENPTINKPVQILDAGQIRIRALAFSPDGRFLAVADEHAIRLWGVE